MNILSEEDFNRIRDSGMLFVILSESDGTYESYLRIYGKEPTMAEKKYNLGNIKIRIKDDEHSRKIQEHLFKMGCKWFVNGGNVVNCEEPYLFVEDDGIITYSSTEKFFEEHSYNEYILSDEEIGYKPPTSSLKGILTPRPGEALVMRDDGNIPRLSLPLVKPPLGLRPKCIADRERMHEILEAMGRYVEEGKKIPVEWFSELDDLNEKFKE